jgi:hypothetical protein
VPPLQRSAPRAPPLRCTAARAPAARIRPRRRRAPGGGPGFVCRRELCAQVQTGGGPSPSARRARRATGRRGSPAPRRLRAPGGRRQRAARERGRLFLRFVRFFLRFVRFFLRFVHFFLRFVRFFLRVFRAGCVFLRESPRRCARPGRGRGRGRGLFQSHGRRSARSPAPACTRATPTAQGRPRTRATRPAASDFTPPLAQSGGEVRGARGARGARPQRAHRGHPSVEHEHGVSD